MDYLQIREAKTNAVKDERSILEAGNTGAEFKVENDRISLRITRLCSCFIYFDDIREMYYIDIEYLYTEPSMHVEESVYKRVRMYSRSRFAVVDIF